MNDSIKACLAAACLALPLLAQGAETLTIATVNNNDMIRMQRLSKVFEESHPDISLKWVVLEENVLRQRLTTDIATQGGQFDLLTIGMYEAALWGAKGWLEPMSGLPADYALDDLLPSVRDGLSVKGTLYALPFYAEASITYYRKDLFQQAGLRMPKQPTWTQLGEFAARLNRPDQGQYGICLRGKAGWGENMALIGTLANAFGARWFDERWQPEFSGGEWKKALDFYVSTLKRYGPPGASSNGFNENLALFNSGKCAIWVDASVAGSFVTDKSQSKVADATGFAFAPPGSHRQGRLLAVFLGPGDSRQLARQGRGEGLRHLGHLAGVRQAGGGQGRRGQRAARHPRLDLQRGLPGRRAVRAGHPGIAEARRSQPSDAEAGALCRHPVGHHPRVPGHRHPGRQAVLRRPHRADEQRPGAGRRAAEHRPRDEARRLSEVVRHRAQPRPARRCSSACP